MNESIAIETVIVLPHSQFYFRYQLNNGVFHTIKKEQAFKYFSQFVQTRDFLKLQDFLQRFLPFIIIVAQGRIIELKKRVSDHEYFQNEIKKDIQNQMKTPVMRTKKSETIPNDNLLNDFYKKLLK